MSFVYGLGWCGAVCVAGVLEVCWGALKYAEYVFQPTRSAQVPPLRNKLNSVMGEGC